VICGVEFEQLLYSIIDQMKQNIDLVQQQSEYLRFKYRETFKIGIPMPLKTILTKISWDYSRCFSGWKASVLLEDDSISEYNLKYKCFINGEA
jgi:hypothetical protein